MHRELLAEVRQRAQQMGATAVIGLRIDIESVGAKRRSLMIAVGQGTAVRI